MTNVASALRIYIRITTSGHIEHGGNTSMEVIPPCIEQPERTNRTIWVHRCQIKINQSAIARIKSWSLPDAVNRLLRALHIKIHDQFQRFFANKGVRRLYTPGSAPGRLHQTHTQSLKLIG
jgi:hypothetical protein